MNLRQIIVMKNLKKLFLHLLIITVLYSNIAVISNHVSIKFQMGNVLPLQFFLYDLFNTFGVFESYSTDSRQMLLLGLDKDRDMLKDDWRDLFIDDYFPFPKGEQRQRFSAVRFNVLHGEGGELFARKFLARKVRERYNRLNPERPIERVMLGVAIWPRSLKGFNAARTEESTKYFRIYAEGQSEVEEDENKAKMSR